VMYSQNQKPENRGALSRSYVATSSVPRRVLYTFCLSRICCSLWHAHGAAFMLILGIGAAWRVLRLLFRLRQIYTDSKAGPRGIKPQPRA